MNMYEIVVIDQGFVYVGETRYGDDGWCTIRNAKNIRRWGTTKGLGELALKGPTAKTVLDDAGEIRVAPRRLVHTLKTKRALWA